MGFVLDKAVLGHVSSANSHSADCSTLIITIYHPGLVQ
jgi:hypothetical protein